MGKELSGELSCMQTSLVSSILSRQLIQFQRLYYKKSLQVKLLEKRLAVNLKVM